MNRTGFRTSRIGYETSRISLLYDQERPRTSRISCWMTKRGCGTKRLGCRKRL